MNATETVNTRTGKRRFYLDGRRVTRLTMDEAKHGRGLDSFITKVRGDLTQHRCSIRKGSK